MPTLLDLNLFLRKDKNQAKLTSSQIVALYSIAGINGIDESWKVNNTSLANQMGVSQRHLLSILTPLIKYNLIRVTRNGKYKNYTVNLISTNIPEHAQNAHTGTILPMNTGTILPVFIPDTLYIKEDTNEQEYIYCSSGDEQPQNGINDFLTMEEEDVPNIKANKFEDFWRIYPRKVGKKRALLSWSKNKCDDVADEIISHVTARIVDDQQWQDSQFIPHPTTFINGELWQDEYLKMGDTKHDAPKLTRSQQSIKKGMDFLSTLKFVN